MRTSPVLRFPWLSAFGARAALRALTALALATTGGLGCSSNSQPSGPACNPCGPTGPQIGRSTNPDGVAYPSPTAGFGRSARVGSTPGDVMQNFKFYGYPGADASKGLQPISLSDYYDPCGKRLKLLHLTAAALWCVPCNQETDAIVAAKATLASAGIVALQALSDGANPGQPATKQDLDYWIARHSSNFTEMLDPGLANLGAFFTAGEIPWNFDIDPRTMEILKSDKGIETDLTVGLSALPAKPSYMLPAVCGDQ